jgi:hypothetical protein
MQLKASTLCANINQHEWLIALLFRRIRTRTCITSYFVTHMFNLCCSMFTEVYCIRPNVALGLLFSVYWIWLYQAKCQNPFCLNNLVTSGCPRKLAWVESLKVSGEVLEVLITFALCQFCLANIQCGDR